MAAVRAALEQRLKSLELELHQVERLQRKFAMIHSTLAQQQGGGAGGGGGGGLHAKGDDTPKLRQSEENPLNHLSRSSLPAGAAAAARELGKAGAKLASMDLGKPGSRQPLAAMR